MSTRDDLIAGSKTIYPARIEAGTMIHLCRTEARTGGVPALVPLCPEAEAGDYELVEEPSLKDRVLRRDDLVWCVGCKRYYDHVRDVVKRAGEL